MSTNKIQTVGLKPEGIKGRIAGIIMNFIHNKQYKNIINKYIIDIIDSKNQASILDIGCGGGKLINILYTMLQNSKIYGIDHSIDMVNLSKKINKKGIVDGAVEIIQGDVNKLPFSDKFFNIITAFDTINFWKDLDISLMEIKRVLKQNGILFIVNGYPKAGTKWYDFVKFKSDDEYRDFLTENGFKEINIVIENNTIIIQALK